MQRDTPTTVIKIGGALLSDDFGMRKFWRGIHDLTGSSSVVIVHGGGPQATELARRLGHEPQIVHGRRVTTDVDLSVMHWTVRGALNVRLVAEALRHDIRAVGISGVDGKMLSVDKRPPWDLDGHLVDFGWVGDIRSIDTTLLQTLLEDGFLPIVAPLGVDDSGQTYNVNADTVACSVAEALRAEGFLLVTEAGGVLRSRDKPESRIQACTKQLFDAGKLEGWISDGMLVKLKVAFDALSAGIPNVHILGPDDLVSRSRGTQVVP